MTDRDLLESLSRQMGELVHHVAEIRQSNTRLETNIKELKDDVATLKTDVRQLQSDVRQLQSDVAQLQNDVAQLQSDVAQLQSDVTQLQSDVTQLQSDVTQLQSDVSQIRIDLNKLETKTDESFSFLSNKIDHFVHFVGSEMTKKRIAIEEERYISRASYRKIEGRVDDIERRLDRLETARATTVE